MGKYFTPEIGNIILVFLSSFLVNFFYACYVKYVAINKMLKAALFGEGVVICGALVTIRYVHNPLYLIPTVTGGFLGTLLTSKLKKTW